MLYRRLHWLQVAVSHAAASFVKVNHKLDRKPWPRRNSRHYSMFPTCPDVKNPTKLFFLPVDTCRVQFEETAMESVMLCIGGTT